MEREDVKEGVVQEGRKGKRRRREGRKGWGTDRGRQRDEKRRGKKEREGCAWRDKECMGGSDPSSSPWADVCCVCGECGSVRCGASGARGVCGPLRPVPASQAQRVSSMFDPRKEQPFSRWLCRSLIPPSPPWRDSGGGKSFLQACVCVCDGVPGSPVLCSPLSQRRGGCEQCTLGFFSLSFPLSLSRSLCLSSLA